MSRSRAGVTAALVGVVLALNLAALAIGNLGGDPSPSGPPSSSYATGADGAGAYADLLADEGHAVRRQRGALARSDLRPHETLVLLDPEELSPADVDAVRDVVEDGGRLVAGARAPGWLDRLLEDPPVWAAGPGGEAERVFVPVPEVRGVDAVTAPAGGTWEDAAGTLPALGSPSRVLLVVAEVGRGRVALLADTSPLLNAWLDRADNAALGLALAGEAGRPVVFAEGVHGFGSAGGLSAIPVRWRWALAGAGLAGLVWIASRARRLGPPSRRSRPLPPPRRAYVDAMAAGLARSRRPAEAVEPVRRAVRERVAVRAGLGRGAGEAELRRAAELSGLAPEEIDAVMSSEGDEDVVVRVGRALARVESRATEEGTHA